MASLYVDRTLTCIMKLKLKLHANGVRNQKQFKNEEWNNEENKINLDCLKLEREPECVWCVCVWLCAVSYYKDLSLVNYGKVAANTLFRILLRTFNDTSCWTVLLCYLSYTLSPSISIWNKFLVLFLCFACGQSCHKCERNNNNYKSTKINRDRRVCNVSYS